MPNVARMYDFYLGGKDNFAADREAAARVIEAAPTAPVMAKANRTFLGRAVTFLARHAGISQFLDIGAGLPTRDNVHEVAQRIRPSAEVVYVDNDPIVLAHARALLASNRRTHIVHEDLREPEKVVNAAQAFLDFDRPVAILLVAVLHFVQDREKPYEIVDSLMDAVCPGSYLVISHAERTPQLVEAGRAYDKATARAALRSAAEISEFFDGLDLVGRGVTRLPEWASGQEDGPDTSETVSIYDEAAMRWMPFLGGVGRKPLCDSPLSSEAFVQKPPLSELASFATQLARHREQRMHALFNSRNEARS
ncbi:SAM-dependent methyltransferase [Microtetraspora malaysiensis]|uniref:SAM-dependent methyltransferase n=1 Tax=Microtetraspora malaysiensis TaxID=161358 RepID=UPI003D8BBDB8